MKTLYDPKHKQINFLDERFYTEDGLTFYPSVTTVLDVYPKGYGFQQWLKDLGHNADEVVKRAGETGSTVHNMIDLYLKAEKLSWVNESGTPIYKLDEWLMFLKFVEFFETVKPTVISNEEQLISHTMKVGGTIDLVCKINDEIWLIDYKTSNAIHTSYELQMSAYAMMWNEAYPKQTISRTGIVWLKSATRGADKTGKKIQGEGWQLKEFDRHYTEAYKLFRHTRAIWDEENPNYKPKNMVYASEIQLTNINQ